MYGSHNITKTGASWRLRIILGLFLLVGLGALPHLACGPGIRSIAMPLTYKNNLANASLTNNTGWRIELTTATLSLGAMRCLEAADTKTAMVPLWQNLGLLPRSAHAHPDHYLPEGIKAELLFNKEIDLLAKSTPVGNLQGFTGRYDGIEVEFGKEHQLRISGNAKKGKQLISFQMNIGPGAYTVVGIPFRQDVSLPTPTMSFSLSFERLFEWIEFDKFTEGKGAWQPHEKAANMLLKALKSNALFQIDTSTSTGAQ